MPAPNGALSVMPDRNEYARLMTTQGIPHRGFTQKPIALARARLRKQAQQKYSKAISTTHMRADV